MADQDFNLIQNIRENIIEAASHYCIDSNLVEGMISKLTRAGRLLDENGWMDCMNGEQCYGTVENFILSGFWVTDVSSVNFMK